MDDRDVADLTTVANVLQALRSASAGVSTVLVRDVLAQTTLPTPRVVALTRRYSKELAVSLGVGHVRYEPGRYVRCVGPTPARIYLETNVSRESLRHGTP